MVGVVAPEKTAVVVDDDPVFVTFVTALLGRYQVTVVAAVSDLVSARQALVAYSPSLAVVDVWLPDGVGFEVMGAVAAAGLETQVVFVTAAPLLARQPPSGTCVLFKPFSAAELAAVLAT